MKTLVAESPRAFAELVLRGARIGGRAIKAVKSLNTEFQGYNLDADALLGVTLEDGEELLTHVEFQSVADADIEERLLEYGFRARKKYGKKPIVCCVIYLRHVGKVPDPPHCWQLQSGRRLLAFDYVSLKLHEQEAETLLSLDEPAMLPLALLTKGGASRTIVEGVFDELQRHGLRNLLPPTHLLASLALRDNVGDLAWLERMYHKMTVDFKDVPAYHWMTDDAREEGRADGLRLAIVSFIERNFSSATELAQTQLALIHDAGVLEKLVMTIYSAQTSEEVERALTDAAEESVKHD
jgi:hypothetical protein